jgi:hypothetical protein
MRAFGGCPLSGKADLTTDLGKTTLLTDAVEKGLVIFGEQ